MRIEDDSDGTVLSVKDSCDTSPDNSKYYSTLGLSYLKKGDLKNSWYYSRKALDCPKPADEAFFAFNEIFAFVCPGYGIHLGITEEEVIEKLGVPDKVILSDCEEEKAFIYGLALLFIKERILCGAFLRGNPNLWEPYALPE